MVVHLVVINHEDIAKVLATMTGPGLVDLSSHAVMKHWVPQLKPGAFADLAKFEMSRLAESHAEGTTTRHWRGLGV